MQIRQSFQKPSAILAPVPGDLHRPATRNTSEGRGLHAGVDALFGWVVRNPSLHLGCNLSAQSFRDGCVVGGGVRVPGRVSVGGFAADHRADGEPATDGCGHSGGVRQAAREFGCRVALDDLGAGFSGIELVRHLRPNVIKIDGCYVRDARRGQTGAATLQRLIGLCRSLAPHVVVEGVEDAGDLERVTSLERVWLQGYCVGKTSAEVEPVRFRWATGGMVP